MKSHFYILIFLFLVFASCASLESGFKSSLSPTLLVNGKEFNSSIINYEADYGYDRSDGDVLMGELEIRISKLTERLQVLKISGNLSGIYINDSEEKLSNAHIKLLDSKRDSFEDFKTDSTGSFELTFNYQTGYLLEFNYVGYRTLFVDISKLVSKV